MGACSQGTFFKCKIAHFSQLFHLFLRNNTRLYKFYIFSLKYLVLLYTMQNIKLKYNKISEVQVNLCNKVVVITFWEKWSYIIYMYLFIVNSEICVFSNSSTIFLLWVCWKYKYIVNKTHVCSDRCVLKGSCQGFGWCLKASNISLKMGKCLLNGPMYHNCSFLTDYDEYNNE